MTNEEIQSGKWIDEYADSMYQLFAGQVVEGFQPIDFFHFFPLWYTAWLEKIHAALERADLLSVPRERLFAALPVPSNIRAHLQKIIPCLDRIDNKAQAKRVVEFFASALIYTTLLDPFGKRSTMIHDSEQINDMLKNIPWQIATVEIAKELGRLITSAGSLAHGLYNDVGTDYAWDAYGPYLLPNGDTLLIRHFTDLQPTALWPERPAIRHIPATEIFLYELYRGVECSIRTVGCHTVFVGSATEGLVNFAVKVDGVWVNDLQKIQHIRKVLAIEAQAQYQYVRNLSEAALRSKVVEQDCYQLKSLFDLVGIDWKPTSAMVAAAQHTLLSGRYPQGRFMTFEEYCQCMGVNELKKLYGHQRHSGLTGIRPDAGQASMTTIPTNGRPWLDEFLDAFAKTVTNSDAAGWMPFDYHRFYGYVSDLMLERWLRVIDRLRHSGRSASEIAKSVGGPLTLRFQLLFTNLFHIQATGRRDDPEVWKTMEFLNDVVRTAHTDDPYGDKGARMHTPQEVEALEQSIQWQEATDTSRKEITRLLSSATHLVWALYSDYCYMNWYEIFGPYPLSGNRQLLIRQYTNFHPTEIWPEFSDVSISTLTLYQIFQDTDIEIDQWSHTTATTPIGPRLSEWAVEVGYHGVPSPCGHRSVRGPAGGGEERPARHASQGDAVGDRVRGMVTDLQKIREIRGQLEQAASEQYQRFMNLSFEQQKEKILELEGYGLKKLFALVGMDWRPTAEMLERIRGKPLLPDKYPAWKTPAETIQWWKTFADPRTKENFPEEWMTKNTTKVDNH